MCGIAHVGPVLSAERIAAEGVTGVTHVTPVRMLCRVCPRVYLPGTRLAVAPGVTLVTLVTLPSPLKYPG